MNDVTKYDSIVYGAVLKTALAAIEAFEGAVDVHCRACKSPTDQLPPRPDSVREMMQKLSSRSHTTLFPEIVMNGVLCQLASTTPMVRSWEDYEAGLPSLSYKSSPSWDPRVLLQLSSIARFLFTLDRRLLYLFHVCPLIHVAKRLL